MGEHCRLPEDVIVDLLSRLPVKSLLRFRCVSKQWFNLISSSSSSTQGGSVKHLHDHGNHRNHYSIFWNHPMKNCIRIQVVDMVAERVHNEFYFNISGPPLYHVICCRELLCFISERVYVCNPSTNELVEVPNCYTKSGSFALGYLPSTKEYKLVRLLGRLHLFGYRDCDDDCEMVCEIFTITDGGRVDSGSWKVTQNLPCMALLSDGVCVNGVISWLVSYYGRKNYANNLMLSFDLDKEEYEMVSCPEPHPLHQLGCGYLLELKGLLCLVHHVYDFDCQIVLIKTWFLKDQKAHDWVAGHNIRIAIMHRDRMRLQPYNAADDNDEGLVLLSAQEGVLYYNVGTRNIRRPKMLRHIANERYKWPAYCFDSFFSLGTVQI